jgi:hypothetical protein
MTDVFVFGSNLAGRHGAGSALEAVRYHGASHGHGWGRYGKSYGIPTKDHRLQTLPLPMIDHFVRAFVQYARQHPGDTFNVVAIGCGLAGYKPSEIAPFFEHAPDNVNLPAEFVLEQLR